MGKLIITSQITLDGVITVGEWFSQHGEHDWHGSAGQASLDQLLAAEAMLLGRKNYEGLSTVWPTMTDDIGFAERVNAMPKYVASRTLSAPLKWNSTLLEGDLKDSVTALKARTKGNLLAFGFGDFARQLIEYGLVEEVRFWFNPVSWGEGERPFVGRKIELQLISTTMYDTGIALLVYRPRS